MKKLIRAMKRFLTDKLRHEEYWGHPNPLAGHCYVASEVLMHLLGDKWKPCQVRHEGASHWYLKHRKTGEILDVTASQFETPVPYEKGRGKGFLTKKPSYRAQFVIDCLKEAGHV